MIETHTNTPDANDPRDPGMLCNPERIAFARQLRGLTQTDLAGRLGCDRAEVARLERGADRPDAKLLARVSMALGLPVAFFQAFTRRTLLPQSGATAENGAPLPLLDRLRLLREAELVLELFEALNRWVSFPSERISRLGWPSGVNPARVADVVREHGLRGGEAPLADLVDALESRCGAYVVLQRLDPLSSFCGWWGRRPFAILPMAAPPVERRYLAARCLGELLLAENDETLRPEAPDEFARALLAPETCFAGPFTTRNARRGVLAEAARWGMPPAAAWQRARELGRLPDELARRADGEGRLRAGDVPWAGVEQPSFLRQSFKVLEGRIPLGRLVEQLAVHPGHLAELLVSQGLPDAEHPAEPSLAAVPSPSSPDEVTETSPRSADSPTEQQSGSPKVVPLRRRRPETRL